MSLTDRRLFFLRPLMPRGHCFFIRLMPAGHFLVVFGLPTASSRCLAKVRKRPLASVRCSVPPYASAIRVNLMVLGCCVGCATKKVNKKVAGNAIPASDSRRNGKSHIPGSAAFTRKTNKRERQGTFNRTLKLRPPHRQRTGRHTRYRHDDKTTPTRSARPDNRKNRIPSPETTYDAPEKINRDDRPSYLAA